MAKKFERKSYSGSANRKIVEVNQRQGVPGIGGMQSTTRVLMDAVKLQTTAVDSTITLFKGCKTRQFPLTNLSENKLQVGESISMQRFSVFILECTTGTTNALGVFNLGYFGFYERFYASFLNFSIAQDNVIKDFPLESLKAEFNPSSHWTSMYQFQDNSTTPVGNLMSFPKSHEVYHFETDMIIPPQIEFVANFTVPPITLVAGSDWYFGMKIEGLGSLYAPKANY